VLQFLCKGELRVGADSVEELSASETPLISKARLRLQLLRHPKYRLRNAREKCRQYY
jgi:hypothetical protein